jgi:hypothetical protein
MTDRAAIIERYLLAARHWVSVEEICRACSIPERLLRADGRRRPIFSRFAISCSTKGVKHITHTTVRERIKYKHSRLKVLIANRRALDEFTHALHSNLTGHNPTFERHTGQIILPL